MEPSDWISISALAASVIISLAGFWFNYKTSKENIRARRAEIVTEKSVDTYRELVEKMGKIETYIAEIEMENPSKGFEEKQAQLTNKLSDLQEFLDKHRVYFPKTISKRLFHLLLQFHKFLSRYRTGDRGEELLDLWATINIEFESNLEQIQKQIGVEIE